MECVYTAMAGIDKKCTQCGVAKPLPEFYLNCYGRNGACKACVAAKNRAYYAAKKADIAAKHAERRAAGVDRDEGALGRRQEAPFAERYAARRAKVNANKAERYRTNARFRAVVYVETKLRRALVEQGPGLEEMVGCPAWWFQEWIEFQLSGGMSPDNYGTVWNYDHVIPKSSFDFCDPEQVRACNLWSNWRPVLAADNSVKHDRRDPALEDQQAVTAYLFQIIQDNWLLRGNNA